MVHERQTPRPGFERATPPATRGDASRPSPADPDTVADYCIAGAGHKWQQSLLRPCRARGTAAPPHLEGPGCSFSAGRRQRMY